MEKRDKQHENRVRNLIIVFALTAVIISVSTFAWFIGMRTVNVSSFDVEIAGTESLMLSLDGVTWKDTVNISEANFDQVFTGNTNSWGGRGLIPASTVGDIDTATSRLKIFEKASLTSTPGGYRLLASQVDNSGAAERSGYVAFDLFVKNFSGAQYIKELNPLDEEAIYLTTNSEVNVASSGVANTGIENSVRVAFAQVGRVVGTSTDRDEITKLKCAGSSEATGICRTAQIWEPNDNDHVKGAITFYEAACKKRTDEDVTLATSYSGACKQIIDGIAYPTYAVKEPIKSSDNVDVYDGTAYNGYETTSQLKSFPYFTDSMKLLRGTARPTFMTLAPNSITKVRVYIYIEGQDVDNYDFASIGKAISVKFGFTKQRMDEEDFDYNGPNSNQGNGPAGADKNPPVIKLSGDSTMTLAKGTEFTDPGATANDNVDGDLTAKIVATGTVNTDVAGTYSILYKVTDEAGNVGTKTRKVIVTE